MTDSILFWLILIATPTILWITVYMAISRCLLLAVYLSLFWSIGWWYTLKDNAPLPACHTDCENVINANDSRETKRHKHNKIINKCIRETRDTDVDYYDNCNLKHPKPY